MQWPINIVQLTPTNNIMGSTIKFIECLQSQLKSAALCSSDEEANAIAEALVNYESFEESVECFDNIAASFSDYFNDVLSISNIRGMLQAAALECWGKNSPMSSYAGNDNPKHERIEGADQDESEEPSDSDSDEELLQEGECELCERTIKLTRHHLIPKSTWSRMKKKLWHAASEIEQYHSQSDLEKRSELNDNLQKTIGIRNPSELPHEITHASIRNYLSLVANICRPCHSAVHRIHDEWSLAQEYNTIDLLLECAEVRRFAKWASKQRPGKYAVK